ncbi:EamA family transporter RarD [Salirhabdus sp. Marseille-P4669]|uniref:EamA family transporter RarD n=1 Tax=Salirhabdus sp. Marseille-P4669 TaxID=2042310 RepID=UPI000C799EB6|nr:EamA family transporter RarD [Salirhabdus sp. Marseille-P4669]
MKRDEMKIGIMYTASAYLLWGFLPIFWKQVDHISAGQILAHRIVWSFIFMLMLLIFTKNWTRFIQECKRIMKARKKLIGITAASLLISLNWLIFIIAVNDGHVLQASLGYYINPLVSILLGVLFLKEKLTLWQIVATALAAIGVIYMTWQAGVFPLLSIILAFTFGLYGLLKKLVPLNSMFGITIETMIVTPIALLFLVQTNIGNFHTIDVLSSTTGLLLLSGIVTAVPLLLFGAGATKIPLSMVGFLQYIAPSLMLVLGVVLYHEPFTHDHFVTFSFIWAACVVYTLSRTKLFVRAEMKLIPKKKAV